LNVVISKFWAVFYSGISGWAVFYSGISGWAVFYSGKSGWAVFYSGISGCHDQSKSMLQSKY